MSGMSSVSGVGNASAQYVKTQKKGAQTRKN